jgi:hypothetical protein
VLVLGLGLGLGFRVRVRVRVSGGCMRRDRPGLVAIVGICPVSIYV